MEITSWLVLVFTGMSSLVAKGSPDSAPQTDASAGDCLNFKLYGGLPLGANSGEPARSRTSAAVAQNESSICAAKGADFAPRYRLLGETLGAREGGEPARTTRAFQGS